MTPLEELAFWKSQALHHKTRADDAERVLAEIIHAHDDSMYFDTPEDIEHALGYADYEAIKKVLIKEQDKRKGRISITEARKPKVA